LEGTIDALPRLLLYAKPMRIFRRLTTLTSDEWALVLEATIALGVAALRIAVLPFHRVVTAAGQDAAPPTVDQETLALQVARIRWAVAACARRLPWRTKCFEQGLAAYWMLTRRHCPSTLHYGVRRAAAGDLEAHVWVCSGDLPVIGCESSSSFRFLATFGA
jgi:hypothetical protein